MLATNNNTPKNMASIIFRLNHIRWLAYWSAIYSIGCIVLWDIFSSDTDIVLRVFAFFVIALAAVSIPARFILNSAYKRNMTIMADNAEIRNSVADFLVNKITAHRCGYENFYIETLMKIGDSRITLCLGILLKSIMPGRRQYAIKTLGNLGGEKAIDLVKAAIEDKNYDVSEEAKKAYSKLTEEML